MPGTHRTTLRSWLWTLATIFAVGWGGLSCSTDPSSLPALVFDPPPGPFSDSVRVTIRPQGSSGATSIRYTLDGTDPRNGGQSARDARTPFSLELKQSTTIQAVVVSDGVTGALASAQYVRAGGPKGSIRGVVVVGSIGVGHEIAVVFDGDPRPVGRATQAEQELPFEITGVETGTHRLVARVDRDDDGVFLPVLDLQGPPVDLPIDLSDPFQAGPDDVRLYVGASADGLSTISGVVTIPAPVVGQSLGVVGLSPSVFQGGIDPATLLQQLQSGYQSFVRPEQREYPYALTNLDPGTYLPTPVLTSVGGAGAGLNLLADLSKVVTLDGGDSGKADFAFGPAALAGTVEIDAPAEGGLPVALGVVAARSATFRGFRPEIQAVLMPVVLRPDGQGRFVGGYTGSALRESNFQVRLFVATELGAGGGNALLQALTWVINPLAAENPDASVDVRAPATELNLIRTGGTP